MLRTALAPLRWLRALEGRRIDDLIPQTPPGLPLSLGVTVGGTAAATLFRWAIAPLVGADLSFTTFLASAAVAAFVLGYGWGLLAAGLGGATSLLLFATAPGGRLDLSDLWSLLGYVMVAGVIIGILGLARSALLSARAEKARAQAASDGLQLISQELSHRIQNIFAVISGMVSLSAREHPEARAYADDLLARVRALGAAHEFVRPHSPHSRQAPGPTTFTRLLRSLFEAYQFEGVDRIVLSGVDFSLKMAAATPVALLFHELATNSLKYGALSRQAGQVSVVATDEGDDVLIRWTEQGGPPVREVPAHSGFGSRLITMSVDKQLRGAVRQDWQVDGLRVSVVIPRRQLTGET